MSHLREFPMAVDGYETMPLCDFCTRPSIEVVEAPPQSVVLGERTPHIGRPFVFGWLLSQFRPA